MEHIEIRRETEAEPEVFADPVAYLARHGIEAELVAVLSPAIGAAA